MILFTADWHIKLGQKNVPVSWAKNRYSRLFDQISELEKSVDLHILGGDLFDRLPTMDELELYFDFVAGVNIPTIIYDGNHEATKKNKTFLDNLAKATALINPLVNIVTDTTIHKINGQHCYILPYVKLHQKDYIETLSQDLPLFTHVRGEIPPHVKPEIDLSRLDRFPIVFAGDLHAHSNTQGNIVYPGSPVTTSFHRNEVKTGYLLIDEKDWSWEWGAFDVPQLLRKTVTSEDEMIATEYHHTIYELEGDMKELAGIKNSDLLDKKVVKRSIEASLILGKEMTIEEELMEYLLYIMELKEENAHNILGTFNDYSAKTQME
jgi:DNA repair exonuclease SbcCD nuclease subunit